MALHMTLKRAPNVRGGRCFLSDSSDRGSLLLQQLLYKALTQLGDHAVQQPCKLPGLA